MRFQSGNHLTNRTKQRSAIGTCIGAVLSLSTWAAMPTLALAEDLPAVDPVVEEPIRPIGDDVLPERPVGTTCGTADWAAMPALLLMLGLLPCPRRADRSRR